MEYLKNKYLLGFMVIMVMITCLGSLSTNKMQEETKEESKNYIVLNLK